MDSRQAQAIGDSIERLEASQQLKRKKIILGPVNEFTMYAAYELKKRGIKIFGIIDDQKSLHGSFFCGTEVKGTEDYLIPYSENKIVLLTDFSNQQTYLKAVFLEYHPNIKLFNLFEEIRQPFFKRKIQGALSRCINRLKASWLMSLYNVRKGKKEYNKLFRNYTGKVFLFPHKSLGDIYIIGAFRAAKAKLFCGEYKLVVVGGGCKAVASMVGFPDENVICVTQREMDVLCLFQSLISQDYPNLTVLHYSYNYTNLDCNTWYLPGIAFGQCYEEIVFQERLPQGDNWHIREDDALDFCCKHKILKSRSVILAPYAKSVNAVPIVFWELLANALKERGYAVFTNCGNQYESPIWGTTPLNNPPLEQIRSIIQYAGFFVGLRSGLCDLIVTVPAKKIFIFPDVFWNKMSVIEHCSFGRIPPAVMFSQYKCPCKPNILKMEKIVQEIIKFYEGLSENVTEEFVREN